jgi:DNA polymerase
MDDVPDIHSLTTLRDAEAACTRCPLYRNATQVVPGEGPKHAQVMLVGEQPGDQEDRQGHPFVGPAGRVLDRAIADAGIDRKEVFVTNAVKHFKFEPRGKRRLHKRPNAGEVDACRWWLDRERKIIKPRVIVALGATAARGLLGRTVTISSRRRARCRRRRQPRHRDDPPLLPAAPAGRRVEGARVQGLRRRSAAV